MQQPKTQACLQACWSTPTPEPPPHSVPKRRSTSSACRHNFTSTTASSLFPDSQFTNHESIPTLQQSFLQFIKAYPNYSDTAPIDQIRARDYPHLDVSGHVCLDYIGVGLFSHSQLNSSLSQKSSDFPLFGTTFKSVGLKPQLLHGGQGSGLESSIKQRIFDFLNISQSEYSMVFTANRSSAFKLVAESYPFQTSSKLLTVYDHQGEAIDSMIKLSEMRGAAVMAAEFKWPKLRVHSDKLRKMILKKKNKKEHGLFIFPLQSRMTGSSYSYQWMNLAHENGWHVLLDACSLSPKDMGSFGLSLIRPDFLICSFYKVFGENPTGFGCLFVKKSIIPILQDSTSGSGIVSFTTPAKSSFNFPDDSSGTDTELEQIAAKLRISDTNEEERTIDCRCLDHVDSLGLLLINSRGRYLINWLVSAMMKLQHPNRLDHFPLVTIYGPKVKFERGPAVAFNIHDWKGEKVEPVLVQKLADRSNISLGHGMLNHIWFQDKCEEEKEMMRSKSSSRNGITVVTAALTFLANFEDVYRLWAFIAQFLDADFVEKERWRYTALNQNTIEV